MGGCRCSEVCSTTFGGASAGQAQAPVSERERSGLSRAPPPVPAPTGQMRHPRLCSRRAALPGPRAATGCLEAGVLPVAEGCCGEGTSGLGLLKARPALINNNNKIFYKL
jgi:hypothetical protein